MARKKRGPPSYAEKYKQIKASKFDVDIPKPTNTRNKSLVTRYHRILFGGAVRRDGKKVHTFGLVKSYTPYNGKFQDAVSNLYHIRGTKRIKNAYFPTEFGHVDKVHKRTISFKTKQGRFSVLRAKPNEIRKAAAQGREALEALLKPIQKQTRIQIISGARMRPQYFDYESMIDEIMDIEEESEEALSIIRIGTFTFA